ncbi:hypothetical protein L6R29_23025 [Myxococcota bacterium]|nr:hypothetical protein [Myxococcota bacterium]
MSSKKKQAQPEVAENTSASESTEPSSGVVNKGAWRLYAREEDGTETHVLSLGINGCLVRSGGALASVGAPYSKFFPNK